MKKKVEPRGSDRTRIIRQSAQRAAERIEREKRKILDSKKENEDAKTRREINQFILAKAFEGRSREDILKRLMFIFHAEKYKPYWKFFEVWTDGAIQKRDLKGKTENKASTIAKSEDESER